MTSLPKHNPYDFANPVLDKDLLVGRDSELRQLRYYLEHAVAAPRPIHVAILGDRASGKTSFLNIAEYEARDCGLHTVRIDLDEGDVENELTFFGKLLRETLLAVCTAGAFGGISAKTYQTFQEIDTTLTVPDDLTHMPFLVPPIAAHALRNGNNNASIPGELFKRDLTTIRAECAKPVLLLVDEANVLSTQRRLLQKLRNVFMNSSGFMLVLAATPELFPTIDDVFSPISRQFKRIEIGAFDSEYDTLECLLAPLKKHGLDPSEIVSPELHGDIAALHSFTQGKPYEIQRVGHEMYRQHQLDPNVSMQLNLKTIEEIRRDLEEGHSANSRPVFTIARGLLPETFRALGLFVGYDGGATLDDAWDLHSAVGTWPGLTRAELERHMKVLTETGLVAANGDSRMVFAGDEFDKLYLKYYAREHEIAFRFHEHAFPVAARRAIADAILEPLGPAVKFDGGFGRKRPFALFADLEDRDPNAVVKDYNDIIWRIYPELYRGRMSDEDVIAVELSIQGAWGASTIWAFPRTSPTREALDESQATLERLKAHLEHLSITHSLDVRRAARPDHGELLDVIATAGTDELKSMIRVWHNLQFAKYGRSTAAHEALGHLAVVERLESESPVANRINRGYLHLVQGEMDAARTSLETALDNERASATDRALASYNLAVASFQESDIDTSLELAERTIAELDGTSEQCLCLLIVSRNDAGQHTVIEEFDVELRAAANGLVQLLSKS